MKENTKNVRKGKIVIHERGITLISLVITIIILLILGAVAISIAVDTNGLFARARKAVSRTNESQVIEEVSLKILEKQIDGEPINKKSDLVILLSEYGTVKEEEGKIKSLVLKDGTEITIDKLYNGEIIEDNATYIYTKEQLEEFRKNVNNGKTYENETVVLMNDIDLKGEESNKETWWTPIGSYHDDIVFKGTFNGGNHQISGIYNNYENTTEYVAFISAVCNATIKNLTVEGSLSANGTEDEKNTSPAVGGVVGISYGKTVIENCNNKINVTNLTNKRDAAGVLGAVYVDTNITTEPSIVTVKNCSNYGTMKGGTCCGGIVGYLKGELTIENCTNYGTVSNVSDDSNNQRAGGILACLAPESKNKLIIKNSYNKGDISSYMKTGGCVGWINDASVQIEHFENTGNVVGTSQIGGCIGIIEDSAVNISNATNLSNQIESAGNVCGGIIGYSDVNSNVVINNAYNTGKITSGTRESGGIIGDIDGITYLVNVYNTGECISNYNGTSNINGATGGIIGSSYLVNAQIHIINAYNAGTMTNNNRYSSGIIGGKRNNFTNCSIKNVYNVGELKGGTNNGIAYFDVAVTLEETQIENAFYLDNVEKGTNASNDTSTQKKEIEMKTQDFVDTLNKYVEKNPTYTAEGTTIKLLKWQQGENGYLSFEN